MKRKAGNWKLESPDATLLTITPPLWTTLSTALLQDGAELSSERVGIDRDGGFIEEACVVVTDITEF